MCTCRDWDLGLEGWVGFVSIPMPITLGCHIITAVIPVLNLFWSLFLYRWLYRDYSEEYYRGY